MMGHHHSPPAPRCSSESLNCLKDDRWVGNPQTARSAQPSPQCLLEDGPVNHSVNHSCVGSDCFYSWQAGASSLWQLNNPEKAKHLLFGPSPEAELSWRIFKGDFAELLGLFFFWGNTEKNEAKGKSVNLFCPNNPLSTLAIVLAEFSPISASCHPLWPPDWHSCGYWLEATDL